MSNIYKMEFLLKIVIFLKPVTNFTKDHPRCLQISEYASDSIITFILKYIPFIYIASFA